MRCAVVAPRRRRRRIPGDSVGQDYRPRAEPRRRAALMSRRLLVPAYLALCILLGGASAAGYLSNMVLQLIALPIIILSLLAVRKAPIDRSGRVLLIFAAVALAVPLLYLIPLPPSVWAGLPGRADVARGYELLGQPLP